MQATLHRDKSPEEKANFSFWFNDVCRALFGPVSSWGFPLTAPSAQIPSVKGAALVPNFEANSKATLLWPSTVPLSVGTLLSTIILWVWQRWIVQRILL